MSATHKDYFLDLYPPNEERLAEFASEAQESLEKQARSKRVTGYFRGIPATLFCE